MLFRSYNNDEDSDLWQVENDNPFTSQKFKQKAREKGARDARLPPQVGAGRTDTSGGVRGGGVGGGFQTGLGAEGGGSGSYTVGNIHAKIQASIGARRTAREAAKIARKAAREAARQAARDRFDNIQTALRPGQLGSVAERRKRRKKELEEQRRRGPGLFNFFDFD